jgi:hypothetical protein
MKSEAAVNLAIKRYIRPMEKTPMNYEAKRAKDCSARSDKTAKC